MLFTPEMSRPARPRPGARARRHVVPEAENPVLAAVREAAAQAAALWVALGSLAVAREDGLWANRSFLIAAGDGSIAARYDKIHMFDVQLATRRNWRESAAYAPGEEVVTAETPLGRLGLGGVLRCALSRLVRGRLAGNRCDAIAIPAAFTVPTGKAHWHLLMRARAVEASAYVIAAAQVGEHADGRAHLRPCAGGRSVGRSAARHGRGRAGAPVLPSSIQPGSPTVRGAAAQPCQLAAKYLSFRANDRFRPLLRRRPPVRRLVLLFGEDFAGQPARGLVACPHCGSARSRPRRRWRRRCRGRATSASGTRAPASCRWQAARCRAEVAEAMEKLAAVQAEALKQSTWVGDNFAEQSRAMHYGERDSEVIHGKATPRKRRRCSKKGFRSPRCRSRSRRPTNSTDPA